MDIRFDDKVVLITGGSTGIGRASALEFGNSGAKVVVNYNSSKTEAEEVVSIITESGGEAIAAQADVSNAEDIKNLIGKTLDTFGTIDVLVNNAGGLLERRKIMDMDEDLWDRVMNLNLKSIYLVTQAVAPIMIEKGYGRIVNVTSIAARNGGGPGSGHYSASKAAVSCLTKSIAKELVDAGIIVNAVAPGVISTPFHDRFTSDEARKHLANITPLKREGAPEETAWPIVFLASEYSSFILGETLEVNGGLLMD